MLKRWNVYHGSENLGLKTAKEIREALRKGTLDPFDKVSAEGSNIREDLIEVDEIFNESADDEGEKQAEFGEAPPIELQQAKAEADQAPKVETGEIRPLEMKAAAGDFMPAYAGGTNATSATNASSTSTSTSPGPNAGQPPTGAWRNESSLRRAEEPTKDNKNNDKRYYLIDKSKILGPLSTLEIQSMFNRNMLNQKVKVQKIGNTKSIPVAQFIATYSEDRLKELEHDGKLNQKVSAPSSKVLNELSRVANAQKMAKNQQNKTYLIVGGAIAVVLLLVAMIVGGGRSSKRDDREDRETSSETRRGGSRPKLLQNKQREAPQASAPAPAPAAEDEGMEIRAAKNAKKDKSKHISKAERQAEIAEEKARKKAEAKAKKAGEKTAAAAAPAPVKVAKAASAPAAASAAAGKASGGSPIAKAQAGAGHVQTIGPVSFSMTALEACSSKCTLTMRDSSGATMKAVFFKTAYYDNLKKSPGAVTLTGSTSKNGNELTILIQDVH